MAADCPFGIFKLFLCHPNMRMDCRIGTGYVISSGELRLVQGQKKLLSKSLYSYSKKNSQPEHCIK